MGIFSSFSLAFFVFLFAGPVPKGSTQYPPRCDPYWSYYNGHCYRFFNNYMVLYDAAMDCYYRRSYIVSIHCQAEADFLAMYAQNQNPVSSNVWIGLIDLYQNRSWTWIETSTVDYTAWEPGQPDNPDHHCVVLTCSSRYWLWNDISCSTYLPYICKKPAYY